MASIRKLIFAKAFYATVIFILEYKTLQYLRFSPVRLFVRPTELQAGIIPGSFGGFSQLTGRSILITAFLSWGFVLL